MSKMDLIVGGLAALTALWLVWYLANILHQARTGVKGGLGVPLLGHLPWVQVQSLTTFHHAQMKRFGDVFRMWYGSTPNVVIASPEAAKQAMTRCPFRFMFPAPMSDATLTIYRDGLLFARDVQYHQTLKSYWLPAFQPAMLEGYYPIMTHVTAKLMALLDLAAEKQQYIDMSEVMHSFAVEITGTAGFGISLESLSHHAQQLGGELKKIMGAAGKANWRLMFSRWYNTSIAKARNVPLLLQAGEVNPNNVAAHDQLGKRCVKATADVLVGGRPESASLWMVPYVMFPWMSKLVSSLAEKFPDKGYLKIKNASDELVEVALDLVKAEKQAFAASNEGSDNSGSGLVSGAFLRYLVREAGAAAEKGDKSRMLTDREMAGNVVTFLGAGSETVANTLTHAVYYLSRPENETWLIRAQEEVDAYSKKHGADAVPTLQQLNTDFPVVEACFNETLRIAPTASYVFREAHEHMTLAGCAGVQLKAKDRMQISLYACNHNPSAWPEPERFIPGRFLPEGQEQYGPCVAGAFMPWGGGTRMCPGRNFAIQEGKLALSQMLKKFTFKVQPGYKFVLSTGVTTAPVHGLPVMVLQRGM